MGQEQIKSPAFQNAELQSERVRIFGVLGFICIFLIVMAVRVFVIRTAPSNTPWAWTFLLAAVVIAYELWMLREVGLALKGNRGLGPQFWILSTILETSAPAFAIAFLSNPQLEAAYRPLASPAVLVFFLLIILSTLRLNPGVSSLSGAVAAITYTSAALYLGWRLPVPGIPAPVTQSNVALYAVTLLVGGLIAAAVAGQIRKHVQSALREAETKQKLEAIQHDLNVARSIQQSLLPQQPPEIVGFDIAGWNQPADDTGGDYFDWIRLADGNVIVTLADVTGHGIGPALLASVCRAYARSNFSVAQNLSTAFEHINQELASDLGTGRFVTFVAATCCPGCAEVEMLSAGHGPIFFYSRPEDRFTTMNAHALPLGMFPFFKSDPSARLQLHTGDVLVLATDGFFEWENDQGEQFGLERMEGVVRASRDSAASEIISHLYDAVIRFSNGTEQQDDLTAVVIKGA
jgi:serine phosphatase RsbU (regulator of sigma subunit)